MLSNAEIGALAKTLGHENIAIGRTQSGARWFIECSCGYGEHLDDGRPTVTRATFDEAVRAGKQHLRQAVKKHLDDRRRNGRVSPRVSA